MTSSQLLGTGAPLANRIIWLPLIALLFVLSACGGEDAATLAPTPPALTVETGGMALPGAAGGAATQAPPSAAAQETVAPTAEDAPVLEIGAEFVLAAPASLYAAPDRTSVRFGEYAQGSRLRVIEPDGDYTGYPVEVDGQRWRRVRADDGLAGWMMAP